MITSLKNAFDAASDEYIKFDKIEKPLHRRADIHAFLLLSELVPGDSNIVSYSSHDEITLNIDCEELARAAEQHHIVDLVRCGVRYDRMNDCLMMFV